MENEKTTAKTTAYAYGKLGKRPTGVTYHLVAGPKGTEKRDWPQVKMKPNTDCAAGVEFQERNGNGVGGPDVLPS